MRQIADIFLKAQVNSLFLKQCFSLSNIPTLWMSENIVRTIAAGLCASHKHRQRTHRLQIKVILLANQKAD